MNTTYDGPNLRSIRKNQRVPLGRVARVAGMTRRHLSKMERGQPNHPVTPAILAAYEKATGVRLTSPDNHQLPPTGQRAGQPAPDGDRVAAACRQRWADLLFPPTPDPQPAPTPAPVPGPVGCSRFGALVEPTQPLPLGRPLMTQAGWWRATSGETRTRLADPHEPRRPDWICSHCHGPWPCPDARQQLRALHGYEPGWLAACMSMRLFDAAADLGLVEPSAELVDRFLAWVGTDE